MQVLKLAVIYFVIVFGVGFGLGIIRVLFLVPQVGARLAELLEMPLMLIAIVLAARWVNHQAQAATALAQLSIGLIALGLLLMAEVAVGVGLRGLSPAESLLNRDPVSGTIYYIMLSVFALLPWLLARARR
jgi:hypothetical protein